MSKLKYFFNYSFSTFEYFPRYSRLEGTLTAYKLSLEKRIKEKEHSKTSWASEIKHLLNQSKKYLDEYKIDEAWRCFHTAQRMEVHGMDENERLNTAKSLKREVSKLNVWRREAIDDLIGNPNAKDYKTPSADTLIQAMQLKDEYYNNQYYKNRLTRGIYKMLFYLLALDTILIILFMRFVFNDAITEQSSQVNMFMGIILYGMLGAITSAILFTRTRSELSRISEINSNRFIVLSKIVVGVGFTIFIYIFLKSDIASGIKLFSFTIDKPLDYFSIAFLSGFTERLAQNAITLLLGDDQQKQKKKKED